MRITLNTNINNPDLEPADPLAGLLRPSIIAGYAMLDASDFSGNGKNLTYAGTFNDQGAVLDGTRANAMTAPISDTSEFTLIYCCNLSSLPAGSPQKSFINSLNVSGATYKGFRILGQPSGGGGFFFAQRGTQTERTMSSTFTGAWTVQMVRVRQQDASSSIAQRVTHGLAITTLSGGTPAFQSDPSTGPIYIGGVPSGVTAAGSIVDGVTGTLGMLLFYNEWFDDATGKTIMDNVQKIMAGRGVTVP